MPPKKRRPSKRKATGQEVEQQAPVQGTPNDASGGQDVSEQPSDLGQSSSLSSDIASPVQDALNMATGHTLAKKISKKFLECAICIQPFRDARALPCHHGFCKDCLKRLVRNSEDKHILMCPTCRSSVTLPKKGVNDLPVHFLVSSLQDTIDMETKDNLPNADSSDTSCSYCNRKKAIVRCLNCQEYLCEICHALHKTWKAMKDHKVVTLEDILSGKVNLKEEAEKYCEIHNKDLEYYCQTEKRAICQDCAILKVCLPEHDRITLETAAEMRSADLHLLTEKCDVTLKNYQDALKANRCVKRELNILSQLSTDSLEKMRKDYICRFLITVRKHEAEVNRVKMERLKELQEERVALESAVKDIERAKEDTTRVTESGTKLQILTNYATLSTKLQELSQSQPETVDKTSKEYLRFEAAMPDVQSIGELVVGKVASEWKQTGQFSTGDFNELKGIAINKDGDIVITSDEKGVKVFSRSGEVRCTLYDFHGTEDVAITRTNKYITPWVSVCIACHDIQGKQLFATRITDIKDDRSSVNSVAIDDQSRIIVGQFNNTISIHCPDGEILSRFETKFMPYRLAVTSNGEIVCTIYDSKLRRGKCVYLMDYSGNNVKTIKSPPDVTTWSPSFVCCRQGEIFIVNHSTGDPSGVYRYTSEGRYIGCLTTDVKAPTGIALSENGMELFVADYRDKIVKIFQRQ